MTNNKKTLEELQADTEAAELKAKNATEALQEAKDEAEAEIHALEAEKEEAKRALEVAERLSKYKIIAEDIAKALRKLGHDVVVSDPDEDAYRQLPVISIGKEDGYENLIRFDTYYSNYSFRSPGQIEVLVGTYKTGVSHYKVRNNGTFNVAGIAAKASEKFASRTAGNKQRAETEAKQNNSRHAVNRLEKKFGTKSYNSYSIDKMSLGSTSYERDGKPTMSIKHYYSFSEDEAAQIIALVQSFKKD